MKYTNKKARKRNLRRTKIRQAQRAANVAKEARGTMNEAFVANRSKLAKTSTALTSAIKDLAHGQSTRGLVKEFKNSLNSFDQKTMGKGLNGMIGFAHKKGDAYVMNTNKAGQMSKDDITVMAAASAGFKTGFYNNGHRKPIFKKKKANGEWESDDEAKKHQKQYKKEYSKWRRKINSNKPQFYTVLDEFKKSFGATDGKTYGSDQVMKNIAEYVSVNNVDITNAKDVEKAVHDIALSMGLLKR